MSGEGSSTARLAIICATALAVFAIWVATDVSADAGIGFFYGVPIALATWWWGARAGSIAVAGCAVLYVVGTLVQPVPEFGAALAVRLSTFVVVVVAFSALRERLLLLEHSAEELEAIRTALTPPDLPELRDVDAAAAFVPSELGVSGDFYLLTNGPDEATVAVVGDVSGHGPRAARLATFIRARLAALAGSTSDPAEILALANSAAVERSGRGKELVSAACIRFDPAEEELTWAIAGHPPPFLLPGFEALPPAGATLPLGAEADLEFGPSRMRLGYGGGVLIYTDGATDVRRGGELLGTDGLLAMAEPLAGMTAKELVRELQRRLTEWADQPIRDDLCLLVLRPKHG